MPPRAQRRWLILVLLCLPVWLHAQPVEEARIDAIFRALDPDYPGLAPAIGAWKAGDLEAACTALLQYYRNTDRQLPWPKIQPAGPAQIELARQAVGGVFTIIGITYRQPERAGGGLDWTHHGPRGDKEWAWMLNRHRDFLDMAAAWKATGDEAFLQTISSRISDWVSSNPYPDRLTFSEAWRALEVARRVKEVWIPLFNELQQQDAFSDRARLLMLYSLLDHADALYEHASFWGGNHLITEKMALAAIAIAFPEFKQSREWLEHAVTRVREELVSQTYTDGAYKELTNHYQRVVLENLADFLSLLDYGGVNDEDLRQRTEAMWNYFAYVTRPSGYGPLNSASDLEHNAAYLSPAADDYDREDWLYIATGGEKGAKPLANPTLFFPWAGHAIMRDGWQPDALWAFFDIGPYGAAHQHADRLHISVSLGQQDFLVDAGRYIYQPGAWRDYFEGPQSHNVILVDGQGALQGPPTISKPLDAVARIEEDSAFFQASASFPDNAHTGRGGASHTRSVYFSRLGYWIVVDQVLSFGGDELQVLWHFHPDVQVSVEGQNLHANGGGRSLWLAPFYDSHPADPAQPWALVRAQDDPPQGWYSPQYNVKYPSTAASLSLSARRPRTIAWLLWPHDDPPPVMDMQHTGDNIIISIDHSAGPQTLLIPIMRR